MIGRFIKFFWFISLFTGLAALLYVYAGLSQQVVYGANAQTMTLDREVFFYIALAVLIVCNFTFYALTMNMKYRNEAMNTLLVNWQLSFAIVLNVFYVIGVNFIFLLNSGEHFNYNNFGFLIILSLALIVLWIIALPVLIIRQRKSI